MDKICRHEHPQFGDREPFRSSAFCGPVPITAQHGIYDVGAYNFRLSSIVMRSNIVKVSDCIGFRLQKN